MPDFAQLERILDIHFKNRKLLEQAFTHRSYINEHKQGKLGHNERLEFLGDAVLELVITDFLFHKLKESDEGGLTAIRSALVNADTCARVAVSLGANDFLLLSKGESKDTGRARTYILANTLEAVIGAVYIDQGYDSAKGFILEHVAPLLDEIMKEGSWIDAKSFFQEKAQELKGHTPAYKTVRETGPDHDKHFTVAVSVGNEVYGEGDGKSKQDAEQAAARNALDKQGWK
jgi:ribonuclease-3